jgi:pilus assembly protein CpaB
MAEAAGMIGQFPNRLLVPIGFAISIAMLGYGTYKTIHANRPVVVQPAVEAPAPVPGGQVVMARHAILRGTVLTRDDLMTMSLTGPAPSGVGQSLDAMIGKTAVTDIPVSQLVLNADVSADPAQAGLAPMVPIGYRAFQIRTNDEIGVGNFIRPGDHVDIELVLRENVLPKQTDAQAQSAGNPSIARMMLQDVDVLAVGPTLGSPAAPPAGVPATARVEPPRGITVALTPEQIAQFELGRSLGFYHIALRNPADQIQVLVPSATLADLTGVTPPPAALVDAGRRPIELVTGSHREVIYSKSVGGPK